MKVYKKQLIGSREKQEDNCIHLIGKLDNGSESGLFAVMDGIGRLSYGDVASRIVARELDLWFRNVYPYYYDSPYSSLIDTFYMAQSYIEKEGEKKNEKMGTTLTVCFIHKNKLICYFLGDTKAFLIHDDRVTPLTHDHIEINKKTGRSALTKACVSFGSPVSVDQTNPLSIYPGDIIVIGSDGAIADTDINDVKNLEPAEMGTAIIDLAEKAGNQDNKTILIIEI